MNKIVIKLYVPCLEQAYDVMVPTFLTVRDIIPLLAKSVADLSDGKYCTNGQEVLCVKDRNLFLEYRYKLSDYGIQNGEQLVLF